MSDLPNTDDGPRVAGRGRVSGLLERLTDRITKAGAVAAAVLALIALIAAVSKAPTWLEGQLDLTSSRAGAHHRVSLPNVVPTASGQKSKQATSGSSARPELQLRRSAHSTPGTPITTPTTTAPSTSTRTAPSVASAAPPLTQHPTTSSPSAAVQPAAEDATTESLFARSGLPATGIDSKGFNVGRGCSDDPASPLPGCSDSPSVPVGDPAGECPHGLTIDRQTTSCGLAENVYSRYTEDGIVTARSPERGRSYTFACKTAGEGTTGYTICLGSAGSSQLYVRWRRR